MSNHIINQDFLKAIERLRKILPALSFGLLIGTYLISAVIMGIFHVQKAEDIGFMIAAYLIPLAIQTGRGTLVFFFQLNPARIQGRCSMGMIAATALLIFSLLEAYFVLLPYGYSWMISVATLMLIGWVIEIMILKETVFATQMELYRQPEAWQELQAFYQARTALMETIEGKVVALPPPPNTSSDDISDDENTDEETIEEEVIVETALVKENEADKALQILTELNAHLRGKSPRPLVKDKPLNGHQL